MNIRVSTYPAVKIFEGVVDPNMTVSQLLKHLPKIEGAQLIVDRNQYFHRIPINDVTNQYYDGHIGEIYKITDDKSLRYRIVVPPIPVPKSVEDQMHKIVHRTPTGSVYSSAYDTIMQMLIDRGCAPEKVARLSLSRAAVIEGYTNGMSIPSLKSSDILYNWRGKAVYVIFLTPSNETLIRNSQTDLKGLLITHMSDIIEHYNVHHVHSSLPMLSHDSFDPDQDPGFSVLHELSKRIELILVYNGEGQSKQIVPKFGPVFFQMMSVQQLAYNVTRRIDSSKHELLRDRDEIRKIYATNGRTLEPDQLLSNYNLRDGTSLMYI